MTEHEDWKKAGRIAAQAREYAITLAKPGVLYMELVNKVEDKIKELGAGIGFPMDLSVNSTAAHDTPLIGDQRVLEKGDLVKLDIGTHINGYVADNAVTVEVGGEKQWTDLIKASREACLAACETAQPGTPLRNIGKIVQQTIKDYGYTPITNLTGHGLGHYIVHTTPTIPNYDNRDPTPLKEGQHIAIEPFATTGIGQVSEGKPATIYAVINPKPVRLQESRKLLAYLHKEYNGLPFAARQLTGTFRNIPFLLGLLKKEGILHEYNVLPEESGGMVSQHENTVAVGYGIITS